MKGSEILLSAEPRGVFKEGLILGTPKPGTMMEIAPAVAPVSGRHSWQVHSGASGAKGLVAILMPDRLQGKLATDAYVNGTRGFLYCPAPGEEMNILVADVAGTADVHTIGEVLMVQSATGLWLIDSSGASKPFTLMETLAALVADTLAWAMYTGQ